MQRESTHCWDGIFMLRRRQWRPWQSFANALFWKKTILFVLAFSFKLITHYSRFDWQWINIGLGNGLAQNRRQAIAKSLMKKIDITESLLRHHDKMRQYSLFSIQFNNCLPYLNTSTNYRLHDNFAFWGKHRNELTNNSTLHCDGKSKVISFRYSKVYAN